MRVNGSHDCEIWSSAEPIKLPTGRHFNELGDGGFRVRTSVLYVVWMTSVSNSF